MSMDKMSIDAIIESITCPITADIMTDPVQGNDGQTYERSAIIQALNIKQESPITRQHMIISDLKVNAAIRFLCDKYHQGQFGAVTINKNPKISTDAIIINHNVFTNNDKLIMSFKVQEDSFPKNLAYGHLSQDIVLIIDHSGSMDSSVEAKNADGSNLENGMSIQDIVNHSAKTVVKTLDSNSRICIIKFDETIDIVNELINASEINKTTILNKIDTIRPRGQTNIWGAIEKGLQLLDDREDKTRNSAILMLTDGIPNVSPARGEIDTLKKLRKNKNFTTPIYTFGFGYNLKRELLYDMAKYANGANGHIPDGNMIATVFCNFIGTILCTVVMNLQLHISPKENNTAYFNNLLMGDFASIFDPISEEYIYDIGTVQYQQERNIVLNIEDKLDFNYFYTYKIGGKSYSSETKTVNNDFIKSCNNDFIKSNDNIITSHVYRFTAIESIRKMINYNRINDYASSEQTYTELVSLLKANTCIISQPFVNQLLKNTEGDSSNIGQVKLAISKEYFTRWGEFYLDQLSRSLNQQIKPNFKDEACMFGKEVFESVVDKASDIFDTLEPPKPSRSISSHSIRQSISSSAPISMSLYNNPCGGCMHSDCLITMMDGNKIPLKNVKRGQMIMSLTEDNIQTSAQVICVVETKITSGLCEMIELPTGLKITAWHPIKCAIHDIERGFIENEWVFPSSLTTTKLISTQSIITLVLDNHHNALINDIPCITLGHNFTNGILDHPYYGTSNIINDLKRHYGWKSGHVLVKDNEISYCKSKNKVSKILFNNCEIAIHKSPTLINN